MMFTYSQHAQVYHFVRTRMRLWQAGAASVCVIWATRSCPCAYVLFSSQDLAVLCTIICISLSYV